LHHCVKARNVAWLEEGRQPQGRSSEANWHVGWGISRSTDYARPNPQLSNVELGKPPPTSCTKLEPKSGSGPNMTPRSSGPKPAFKWILKEE